VDHIQKVWDGLVATNVQSAILSRARCTVDKTRLLAASSRHSGDWLHAPSITAVGLRLSGEVVRVAVAHRLGNKACEPHTCVCGKAVDGRGLHGLSCCRRSPRQQRHSHLNDILWRAIKRTQHITDAGILMLDNNHLITLMGQLFCPGQQESLRPGM